MADKTQLKPLGAASSSHRSDLVFKHGDFSAEFTSRRRQKCIKICGCSAAALLILVMILLTLTLTVFHIKDPSIRLLSVGINGLDAPNSSITSLNLTVVENVSIKNPNIAAFKFDNMTTSVYYNGSVVVGEGRIPAGKIDGRRTVKMKVSVEVMMDKIMEVAGFDERDLCDGIINVGISTCTRISGKIKDANFVRSVAVKLKCTMNVNTTTQAVEIGYDAGKEFPCT